MTRTATMTTTNGRYTRGITVVLGVMVVFAFMMLIISAGQGKATLSAFGASESDPVSGLSSVYSADTCDVHSVR